MKKSDENSFSRRSFIKGVGAVAGGAAFMGAPFSASAASGNEPLINPKDDLKVTELETFLVKPRWIFLKIHTNAGIIGLGEPLMEGRAETIQTAIKEVEPYLVGKDPRRVTHHWQAIYRDTFYRGGPLLTSALSGIDQALWDIKGKALGVPVYELLGGPTRNKIKVYAHAGVNRDYTDPFKDIKEAQKQGFTDFKTGVAKKDPFEIIETKAAVDYAAETFAEFRKAAGPEANIGIDFHGAVSPATARLLIKAYEPYQPYFIEEPVQCQNVDVLADIARGTYLPIATGERVFTKWGFREILEKQAASILQPDMCHAGGITEVRLIAGMAEAYYAGIAPHNPMGPISLAAGIQLAASIPNFLIQEQVSLGEGYITEPFKVEDGYIPLPTKPGLGIELDEDQMEDKLGHDWQNPQARREDGSVMDW
jgi:galactonate dehydratase